MWNQCCVVWTISIFNYSRNSELNLWRYNVNRKLRLQQRLCNLYNDDIARCLSIDNITTIDQKLTGIGSANIGWNIPFALFVDFIKLEWLTIRVYSKRTAYVIRFRRTQSVQNVRRAINVALCVNCYFVNLFRITTNINQNILTYVKYLRYISDR